MSASGAECLSSRFTGQKPSRTILFHGSGQPGFSRFPFATPSSLRSFMGHYKFIATDKRKYTVLCDYELIASCKRKYTVPWNYKFIVSCKRKFIMLLHAVNCVSSMS